MRSSVSINRLQCEHYANPIGIGESSPRLSWRFNETTSQDWIQSSYQLTITRRKPDQRALSFFLKPPRVFRIEGADSVLVPWPDDPLESGEIAHIEVIAYGPSPEHSPTVPAKLVIEAGLLRRSDWIAIPITCEPQPVAEPRRPFRTRSSFIAPASFRCARLYITAMGMYEAHINGQRIGDYLYEPGWTAYQHHVAYRTYDVTDIVQAGKENVLGAWVGEGWYTGRLAWLGNRNHYGERPAVIAQLEIDGTAVLATDEKWQWSYGALILSELLDGETFDSTIDNKSWCTPFSLSEPGWSLVEALSTPQAELVATLSPPVTIVKRLTPVQLIKTPKGKTILDFGQNFAGLVEIIGLPPSEGQLILRYAEVLEHDELGTRPLRTAGATDKIILGGSVTGYIPKFTSHGFRYLEVSGWPNVSVSDVVGLVAHSSMERTGYFSCSHKLINRLHDNVVWSTISNTISLPTDCPQRDERLGWTGDIQVFSPTLNFLFDSTGFLSSWLKDLGVEQEKHKGTVPVTVPDILPKEFNAPLAIWGDAAVITPWDVYVASGDLEVLRRQYESAEMWLKRGIIRSSETGLWDPARGQLSDWLAPKAPPDRPGDAPTDRLLVADAYLIHTTKVMAKIANALGKEDESIYYNDEATRLTDAFYSEYVTPNGRVMSDTQTALALLIQFGIFPSKSTTIDYPRIFSDRLAELVENDDWKVASGFAGTPIILLALAKAGQLHQAYRMLQSRDTPSWLSPILLGATTIWERWNSMLDDGTINPGEMTSFNHYALGSVAAFMHSVVAGLSPIDPGWKEFLVKPQPGGTIASADASFTSPYGRLACSWEIKGEKLDVRVVVPPNSYAHIELPGLMEIVGSGEYNFSVDYEKDLRFPPKIIHKAWTFPPSDNWER